MSMISGTSVCNSINGPEAKDARPSGLASLLSRAVADPREWVWWLGAIGCLELFRRLFLDNLWHFYYVWSTDENYSHGFLVPLISLYFANQVACRGETKVRGGVALGCFLLAVALGLRLVTIPLPIPFLGDIAFLLALTGIFAMLFGQVALRRYWFSFFFLLFMIPLPIALYSQMASPLQLLASRVASSVMNATGLPVLCEGNRMTLPGGVQMFVAEACSGMRQLTGFLALTTAVAYYTPRPAWCRITLIVSALPIALSANIARVILTGYIMHFVNPEFAEGTYHTIEGLLMMGFGLAVLSLECRLLDLLCDVMANPEAPSVADARPASGQPRTASS